MKVFCFLGKSHNSFGGHRRRWHYFLSTFGARPAFSRVPFGIPRLLVLLHNVGRGSGQNQHRVAVAVEAVAFADRLGIRRLNQFESRHRGYEHEQRAGEKVSATVLKMVNI